MKTNKQFWSYLAQFFLEWEMFQTKFVEEIKTHILCSVTFFRKSYRLWDNVEKYCRAGQVFFFFQALNFLVESFDLLNDLFPLPSILDAGYPIFDLHLADVLFDVILPSVLGSSLWSFG